MPADGLENNTIITCDRSDWIKLKQSFSRATEAYQSTLPPNRYRTKFLTSAPTGEDAAQSLALLRDVLDECHRFLSLYKDPSILFIEELPWPTDPSPIDLSPSHGHVPRREWSQKQSGRENARR